MTDRFTGAAALIVFLFLTLGAFGPLEASAQTLVAEALAEAPPAELNAAIKNLLGKSGVRVTSNGTTLDFWWADLKAESWEALDEGAVVGAMRVAGAFEEIRGKKVAPGVYTLRYGLQPQNGDHLGVSENREFLLVSPAAVDKDPAPHGHEGTIELSKQAIGGSHPGVLSIDPPVANGAALSMHKTELDHDAVIVEVPVTRSGKPAGTMKFGIVLVGRIEA